MESLAAQRARDEESWEVAVAVLPLINAWSGRPGTNHDWSDVGNSKRNKLTLPVDARGAGDHSHCEYAVGGGTGDGQCDFPSPMRRAEDSPGGHRQLTCTDAISGRKGNGFASSFPQAARAGVLISCQGRNLPLSAWRYADAATRWRRGRKDCVMGPCAQRNR
jgi:hypothetical protein